MPKTRQQKKDIIKNIVEKFDQAKSAIIADYTGLTVPATEELRQKCKDEQVELIAVKKTLLKKALQEAKIKQADQINYQGSLLLAFGLEDEVAPAKIINSFAKDHEQVQFCSGILEGKIIDAKQVKDLAALPSKLELYAKIVGSLNAPVSGFVNVMVGNLRGLVNVLSAIKDNKEK